MRLRSFLRLNPDRINNIAGLAGALTLVPQDIMQILAGKRSHSMLIRRKSSLYQIERNFHIIARDGNDAVDLWIGENSISIETIKPISTRDMLFQSAVTMPIEFDIFDQVKKENPDIDAVDYQKRPAVNIEPARKPFDPATQREYLRMAKSAIYQLLNVYSTGIYV